MLMSEISKLYENAGVYNFRYDCNVSFADGDFGCITNCSKGEVKDYCTDKKYFKKAKVINVRHLYPPFTAEKQIELIKWLAARDYGDYTSSLLINVTDDRVYFSAAAKPKNYVIEVLYDSNRCTDFGNALANLVGKLWQDLTPEEKLQVKGILE